jgi:hypothetical protein
VLAAGDDETWGGMVEVSAHLRDGKLHPYVRFDQTALPEDGGPYLSLRETDGGFTRVYVPEFKAGMTSIAYDVNQHMRVTGRRHHDDRADRQVMEGARNVDS